MSIAMWVIIGILLIWNIKLEGRQREYKREQDVLKKSSGDLWGHIRTEEHLTEQTRECLWKMIQSLGQIQGRTRA